MKVTNETLKRFVKLSKQIAKANKERGEIRKAILEKGSFSTSDYVVTIEALKKEGLVSKEKFFEVFGRDCLLENNLLKTYISQEVNVVEKREALLNVAI